MIVFAIRPVSPVMRALTPTPAVDLVEEKKPVRNASSAKKKAAAGRNAVTTVSSTASRSSQAVQEVVSFLKQGG